MPNSVLGSRCGRFHLKDGRTLIFQTIRRPFLRRRAGGIALALLVVVLGFLAATLFARSRPDAHAARRTREAAVISVR